MKKIFAFMSAAMMLTACGSDEPNNGGNENPEVEPIVRPLDFPVPEGEAPEEPVFEPTSAEDIAKGMSIFSSNFYNAACEKAIIESGDKDNMVVSPMSAYYALAMLANGAAGDTRAEIVNAFGLDNVNMTDLNSFASTLKSELADSDGKVTVETANSIWLQSWFPIYRSYMETLDQYYEAEPRMIIPETFKEDLNAWCDEKTHGLIKEFPISAIPDVALCNALYFKGAWTERFDEKLTKDDMFHNFDGTTKETDFMHSIATNAVKKISNDATTINIFMGEQRNYSFNVVIPNDPSNIDAYTSMVIAPVEHNNSKSYNISMPKFKIDNLLDITPSIYNLGIHNAFSFENSDFSRLTSIDLYVNLVKQANNFTIDEKGIEAASVTITGLIGDAGPGMEEPKYEEIVIDRPFLFSVTERTTGAILFMGKVTKL